MTVHPRTGHEGPNRGQRYSSTLSLTSALDWGLGGQRRTPASLPQEKRPSTHFTGGAMVSRVDLEECEKFRSYRNSSPGLISP